MVTILLVDDEEEMHHTVARSVGNVRLLHAYNGGQALDILSEESADLVLLDLNLPDTTGFKLIGPINRRPNPPIIIMLSADFREANVARAIELGATDFLDKCAETYAGLAAYVSSALTERR